MRRNKLDFPWVRIVLAAMPILFGADHTRSDDVCPPTAAPSGYDFYLPCIPHGPEYPAFSSQIYFEQHSTALPDEARAIIRRQADVLKQHPELTVDFVGFADIEEAPSALEKTVLGGNRAASVRAYLIELGIESERLNAHGREYSAVIPRVLNEETLASMRFVYAMVRGK